MSDVELRIAVGNAVEARRVDSGAEFQGAVRLDPLEKRVIGVLSNILRTDRMRRREELEVLGSLLYRTIFDGPIDQAFTQALEAAQEARSKLRLRLQFKEASPVMWDWPWEFLHRPPTATKEGFFLAIRLWLTLSRFVILDQPVQPLDREPQTNKLRVLNLISNGQGLQGSGGQVLGPVEARMIGEAIDALAERYPIEREELIDPGRSEFEQTLERFRPHVLHFIGFGRLVGPELQPQIGLFHDKGGCQWGDCAEVARAFEWSRYTPPVIVMHLVRPAGARTWASWDEGSFAGLAEGMVRRGAHAAIAMHYPIPPDAAVDFSRELYEKLASGLPIEDAVQKARYILSSNHYKRLAGSYDEDGDTCFFGAPLLYSHHAQFPIMERALEASGPPKAGVALSFALPRNP